MKIVEGKCHTCSSCRSPSLGTRLLPLRVSFLPHTAPPCPKNYCSSADAGHRLCLSGDTHGLATAARDRSVLALCGLQKWSRHPCTGVSIGVPSPHTASESRWTFHLSYYGLFYSLTHVGKNPGNMVPKWIQTFFFFSPSIFNFKTIGYFFLQVEWKTSKLVCFFFLRVAWWIVIHSSALESVPSLATDF